MDMNTYTAGSDVENMEDEKMRDYATDFKNGHTLVSADNYNLTVSALSVRMITEVDEEELSDEGKADGRSSPTPDYADYDRGEYQGDVIDVWENPYSNNLKQSLQENDNPPPAPFDEYDSLEQRQPQQQQPQSEQQPQEVGTADIELGELSRCPIALCQQIFMDSIAIHFYFDTFLLQFAVHMFFPLAYCFVNYRAQQFLTPSFFGMLINVYTPVLLFVAIIMYFLAPAADRELFTGAVNIAIILLTKHKLIVSLKYASLSRTEYNKFQQCTDLQLAGRWSYQMMLFLGWYNRDPLLMKFELGSAAARIGAKINEIFYCIADPTESVNARNEFMNWQALLTGERRVRAQQEPGIASGLLPQENGTFFVSVYDTCRALIISSDKSARARYYIQMVVVTAYTISNASVPFVEIAYDPAFSQRSPYIMIFLALSTFINLLYGFIAFNLLFIAVWDIARLVNMVKFLHLMIRTTDIQLDTKLSFKSHKKDREGVQRKLRENMAIIMSVTFPVDPQSRCTGSTLVHQSSVAQMKQHHDQHIDQRHVEQQHNHQTHQSNHHNSHLSEAKTSIEVATVEDAGKPIELQRNEHLTSELTSIVQQDKQVPQVATATAEGDADGSSGKSSSSSSKQKKHKDFVATPSVRGFINSFRPPRKDGNLEFMQQQLRQDQVEKEILENGFNARHGGGYVNPGSMSTANFSLADVASSFQPPHKHHKQTSIALQRQLSTSNRQQSGTLTQQQRFSTRQLNRQQPIERNINIGTDIGGRSSLMQRGKSRNISTRLSTRPSVDSIQSVGESSSSHSRSNGKLKKPISHRNSRNTRRFSDYGNKGLARELDPVHIPKVSLRLAQNVVSWIYSRLVFQHFGERFRVRIDFYAGGVTLLMFVLMLLNLVNVISANEPSMVLEQFETTFFYQSTITIIMIFLFTLVITTGGAVVNEELAVHSRTMSAHVLRIRDEILIIRNELQQLSEMESDDENDDDLDKEEEALRYDQLPTVVATATGAIENINYSEQHHSVDYQRLLEAREQRRQQRRDHIFDQEEACRQQLEELQEAWEMIESCRDVADSYTSMKPLKMLGVKIYASTVATIFTTGVSYFTVLYSIYSSAKTQLKAQQLADD